MLWLAGLLGIVSVGATSLVVHEPELEGEPEDDAEDPAKDAFDRLSQGDIFEFLNDFSGDGTSDEPRTPERLTDAFFSAEDDTDYDVFDTSEVADRSVPETAAAQVLQYIVEDPEAVGLLDAEAADNTPAVRLWDWIAQGETSEVLDYDARTESLMLVWDDLADGAEEPDVRVEQDPFDAEVMHVLMNNKSVAEVYGDPELTSADITMIPLSSALIVGFEPT